MKREADLKFVALSSRHVANIQGDTFSIDEARTFIRHANDINVLPWKDEKCAHILSTGRAYALVTGSALHATAFSASLNADETGPAAMVYPDTCSDEPDDREVGGILTAKYLRGARIHVFDDDGGKFNELSLARGFVTLVTAQTLYDVMGTPGFVASDPLPVTYNTMDTAKISRLVGHKLGFRAPLDCSSAHHYSQRGAYKKAFKTRTDALGHSDFQLAYLQARHAKKIVADTIAILRSPEISVRVGRQQHQLQISERLFPSDAVQALLELQQRLDYQR